MYAFHSDEAMDMFRRLPRVKGATALEPSQLTVSFRQLRKRLVDEGWFNREWKVFIVSTVQYVSSRKLCAVAQSAAQTTNVWQLYCPDIVLRCSAQM
jgi:hypothetical protein